MVQVRPRRILQNQDVGPLRYSDVQMSSKRK